MDTLWCGVHIVRGEIEDGVKERNHKAMASTLPSLDITWILPSQGGERCMLQTVGTIVSESTQLRGIF